MREPPAGCLTGCPDDGFMPFPPLGLGKQQGIAAVGTAAALIKHRAFGTLDKQQMAPVIAAIGMGSGRPAALMALRDDLAADPLAHPVVENKVLPLEFILQPLFPDGIGVMNDTALQVINVGESLVQQPGAGLFAADTPGAVHDDGTVLLVLQEIGR